VTTPEGAAAQLKQAAASRQRAVAAQPPRDEPVRWLVSREQRNGRQQPLKGGDISPVRGGGRAELPSDTVATASQIDHGKTALGSARRTVLTPSLRAEKRARHYEPGTAILGSVARLGEVNGLLGPFKELVHSADFWHPPHTAQHPVVFNYVQRPDCPPEQHRNGTYCGARRFASTVMVNSLEPELISVCGAITSELQERCASLLDGFARPCYY